MENLKNTREYIALIPQKYYALSTSLRKEIRNMAMYTEQRSQLEIFSQNLRDAMYRKNISQNALAKKLDCSVSTVNSWCQGTSLPRRDRFDRLCQFLNVSRFDLLSDREAIMNLSVPAAHPLKVLGRICAGNGFLCEESFEGLFFVDNSIRADYCLAVYLCLLVSHFTTLLQQAQDMQKTKDGTKMAPPFVIVSP